MMHLNPSIAALLNGLNNLSLPGIDLSLVRMRELMKALGNPEKKIPPVIHLAGTNGKGSTLAFLRDIYQVTGYRVHAYTSPHLVSFNERITIAGHEVSDDYLLDLLQRITDAAKTIPATFFEATTAAAFLAFSENSADMVLLETGLGGRLDATNVVERPIATIITPVDYDHMEFLGNTLGDIAAEKAGIMKYGAPCFMGSQKPEAREVLKRAARTAGCELIQFGREWDYTANEKTIDVLFGTSSWNLSHPALPGAHQFHNAALASVVALSLPQLPVTLDGVTKAIAATHWPARLQRLTHGPLVDVWNGEVYLDGGHNPGAAEALRSWLDERAEPVTLLCGMMKRKDVQGFLKPIAAKISRFIAVPIEGNDSFAPEQLAATAQAAGIVDVRTSRSLMDATATLQTAAKGTLLIAGSLFLAGEVLKNHS
ncbi:MAG: bifunctional folylpolyglutamate synthase/dihydrofolate synthase [Rickettsiales bacterium]